VLPGNVSPQTDIKVFATGLGAGILLDATVVRALLVPALMSMLGQWNWWLPRWLARVLLLPVQAKAGSASAGSQPMDGRVSGDVGSRSWRSWLDQRYGRRHWQKDR